MKNVLFVCTGNTCRSPMAEFILRDILAKNDIEGVNVSSAGLSVFGEDTINPNSKIALEQNGILVEEFASRQLTQDMLEQNDLVVCMTQSHKNALPSSNKIVTLGELTDMPDINDPYGGSLPIYLLCFQQMRAELQILVEKFWPNSNNQ